MTHNNDRFTGGDGLIPGTLEHATHLVMMSNELNGGLGAYRISNAVLGASGPSYGPFQYDLGGNSRARELFEKIATTASDVSGRRFITDQDLETIRNNLYQPFRRIQENSVAKAAYDRLLPAMNSALSSDAGRRLINEDYLVGVDAKIRSVNSVISSVADPINRNFLEQNRLAKLIVLDTANQYGPPVNDGLKDFMEMNALSSPLQIPGRRHAEQISVTGSFGIEEMVRLKLETQYGQTDAGARDVLRRISNIAHAVGVYEINLSQEDQDFLQTGLSHYLVDNGRDPNILDGAALSSLRTLAQITDAERAVAHIQKNLNALGIPETQGQRLAIDGDLGGLNSRTNQAIAAFKQQHGLMQPMSNTELLMATQVALKVKQSFDFDRPVLDGLPSPARTPQMVNGLPDYMVPDPNALSQNPPQSLPHSQRDAQVFPTSHRDYPLFEAIRRQLPTEYSDDMAAHATLEAKKGGISRPDQIAGMAVENGRLTVMGKSGMDFAVVELTASAPPLQETVQQSATFDRQQAIQLAQFQEQQQQMNIGRGPSMTL